MDRYLSFLLLFTTLFLSFYNLGTAPMQAYDEARHGVIAIEMLHNQEWFNYYYAGVQDTWFSKPPLGIWAIVGSMKIFGTTLFALRFPSAIATLLIIFFSYKTTRLFEDEKFSSICCLIMLSVKGIVGVHVGRTGDLDAMLLAFLMMGVYYLLKNIHQKNKQAIYLSALGFGIAFWVKGPAIAVFFPGIISYLIISKAFIKFFKNKHTWLAGILLSTIILICLSCILYFSSDFKQTKYVGENYVETMFLYDIVERFSNPAFEINNHSWDFFPVFLDVKFNIWNYFFYLSLLLLLFQKYLSTKWKLQKISTRHLLIFSLCIWISLAGILSILNGQRLWYLAPIIPFIAITMWYGLQVLYDRFSIARYLFLWVLVFTIGRQVYQMSNCGRPHKLVKLFEEKAADFQFIKVPQTNIDQSIMALCYFQNKQLIFENEVDLTEPLQSGEILLLSTLKSAHDRTSLKRINNQRIIDDMELYYPKSADFLK